MSLIPDYNPHKKCFIYCGDRCNCSAKRMENLPMSEPELKEYTLRETAEILASATLVAGKYIEMPDDLLKQIIFSLGIAAGELKALEGINEELFKENAALAKAQQ